MIIISPFSRGIAKNYIYFQSLINLLKDKGLKIHQIGLPQEKKFENIDKYYMENTIWEQEKLFYECKTWISVDNFFPHLNNYRTKKPGCVIWTLSDPEIFGYNYNLNIYKNKNFFRKDQYGKWDNIPNKYEYHVAPEFVVNQLVKEFNI